ncbi:hypothetical protein [Vibrio breoganii]|uniref:hypothetical protein n=1 Tax=Vibrio breoganii TaxID=553239 RepID=UPI000380462F|nr:hypothetical protein [Vibrio breoganii]OCH73469.1 hypothetical protein A6D95_16075 [Vibrio breoganii]OED94532.1 hypothetical protein A1QG_07350 [Vibrio breoganii ZF-29]OEF82768.1 hypothetical protein B003_01820 [Vibrio breoganii 1C10]PMG99267.1 hypothetical protein BCU79_03775 [Vibrio breoganii]PML12889.1 hypothetical protein BCT84_15105 [Vibrio breoganii]
MNGKIINVIFIATLMVGCSNNASMGQSVAYLKSEQVYNPNATQENKDVLPPGSGERTQQTIKRYNKGSNQTVTVSDTGFGS